MTAAVQLLGVLVMVVVGVTPRWGCLAQGPTVTCPLGPLRGRVRQVQGGRVAQFLGVPYAQPPLNQLRFRKPQPIPAWSPRTLDATRFRPSCPQIGDEGGDDLSEDCLYLNIYVQPNDTRSGNTAGLRPVMVWIHGGGFVEGSGSGTDGSLMAVRGGVVVVTVNYRLGMLGWLSTLDAHCPGNNGLWDQKMALHWVQDNIAAFGGDPKQITIFGESGGGYSVGLHAVTPLNNGLFQRAVMQSGTALNRRTIALDPRGYAQRFANSLGCLRQTSDGFDTRFFIDCARERTVDEILAATTAASNRSEVAWLLDAAPVIDGELIPTDVRTLLLDPRYRDRIPFWTIDVMVGTTTAEGSLVAAPILPFQTALGFDIAQGIPTRVLCSNVTRALARDYLRGSQRAAEAMCGQYTSRRDDADQARQVVDLYGDMMFTAPAVETLLLHANGSVNAAGGARSSFQYLFSFTPSPEALPYTWFQGAAHWAEVKFLFGIQMTSQDETRLSLALIDGWTNFAKYGTPNGQQNGTAAFVWPSFNTDTQAFTNIDRQLTAAHDIYAQRMRFWEEIAAMDTETRRPRPATNSASLPALPKSPCLFVIVYALVFNDYFLSVSKEAFDK